MAKKSLRKSEEVSPDEAAAPQTVGDTTAGIADREKVANRAYELYLERGRSDGRALDDWLNAERELLEANPSRRQE